MKNELLPADTYVVINKSIIVSEDVKIINMLYLPIIGSSAAMLYFSLISDLEKNIIMSKEYTHHHLVTNMHLSIDEFISARSKLEAIGLVKTYLKESSVNSYVYELYSPLSVYEFFNHPTLNIVLYNNIGKKEYESLKEYYRIPKISLGEYTEVTKKFNDVFMSVPLTSYEMINDDIRKRNKLKLNIDINFDFNFLIASMPKGLLSDKAFTKDVCEIVLNLAYIYDIDVINMANIIKACVNEKGSIVKDDLRKTARNYYQFEHGGLLPSVVDNTQPEYLRKPVGDTSKRSKMIYTFETVTPYNFLKSKSGNAEPTKRDLKLVEDLIIDYGLKPGVVNVLIDYTLKTNQNKLVRSFVETIAGQWKRSKIETVEDAMGHAEKEHRKYRSNKLENKSSVKTEEKIPEWFDKVISKEKTSKEEEDSLRELLKEYD